MARDVKCPICGDPSPFKLWMDERPPVACAYDEGAYAGGSITIKAVTDCPYQMRKASQQAHWRKACPEEFDANGNLLEGGLARVLQKLYDAGDRSPLII